MYNRNSPETIQSILTSVRTIALVGASDKPHRPSFQVMEFLQNHGYRIIPVNPRLAGQTLLGEKVYPDLTALPTPVDMAELFLASDKTDSAINQAIAQEIPIIWLQVGVINEAGAERAEAAGCQVIMDRCPKQEIPRLGLRPVTH